MLITDEATPCLGNPEPFDVLIDHIGGPGQRVAVIMAREVCGTCPAMTQCFRENRDEAWVQAIIGGSFARVCRCGKRFAVPARGATKIYCGDVCSEAARKAAA